MVSFFKEKITCEPTFFNGYSKEQKNSKEAEPVKCKCKEEGD